MRTDGRQFDELRPVRITKNFTKYGEGSVLIETGDTKVLCTASVEEKVPQFLKGLGQGWITAEYSMLPRSTAVRKVREITKGRPEGRTHEIQRLIGRSLRSVTNLDKLGGEYTIWIDCDVLQADGGTRTASITGACVAVHDALMGLVTSGTLPRNPMREFVAAVSVGIHKGAPVLDLDYAEDSDCDTDMNVVMTEGGGLIEVQGTAEGVAFSRAELNALLDLADSGIRRLFELQRAAVHGG